MASVLLDSPMVWGAAGAFIYGAPRLSACIFTSREAGTGWLWCALEFAVALIIGVIAAGAFAPWIAMSVLKATDPAQTRAIAATIGLLANPIAPRVVETLSSKVLQMLKGAEK